jgi:hypothetical protein
MNGKQKLVSFLGDIRFWIIFFFLMRMYGITNPPLEVTHNIRQTDGLMIARNFYEGDRDIRYPTIDVAGEKSGIIGCEFPIMNYLVHLLSLIFGFEDWFGRLINLVVSSTGIYCFFLLIKRYFDESSAFNSSIILLVSLWFTFSRKNIPDTFAASLCITALFFAFQFFERGKWYHLLFYFLFGALGCLSKISAATLLTVLIFPVFFGSYSLNKKIGVSAFSIVILGCVYVWYFVWVPYLNNTFGFQMFFMGWSFNDGIQQLAANWRGFLARFYDTALKYTGFLAFLVGFFLLIKRKYKVALAVFLLPFISFLIVMVKSGSYFVTNEYYILVIIPVMAFIAGTGLAQLKNKTIVAFALVVISVEGIANKTQDFRIRHPYTSMLNLETIMDSVSTRKDLIAINGNGSGTPMFFAHRRGWISTNEMLSDTTYINSIHEKGCKYILILRDTPGRDMSLDLPIVYDSDYSRVYRLP